MGDIIVLSVLGIVVGLVIYSMIRSRKDGKGGCSCGCSSCAMSEHCQNRKK